MIPWIFTLVGSPVHSLTMGKLVPRKKETKHLVEGDYSRRRFFGALPTEPTKPVAFSMTEEDEARYRHHGAMPTLDPIWEKALQEYIEEHPNQIEVVVADQEPLSPRNLHQDLQVLMPPNTEDVLDEDQTEPLTNTDDVVDEDPKEPLCTNSDVPDEDREEMPSTEEQEGGRGTPSAST